MTDTSKPVKKKICIVGAGSAGTACAWLLGQEPDKFDVQVWEKASVVGGVATSETIGQDGLFINDGVQGGAPSYRNTILLHQMNGFKTNPVHMKISFGKNTTAWNNQGIETDLVKRLKPEIARFGRVLKWVSRFELVFIFVPISKLLRLARFSPEFSNYMVFPLTALFFGTGNQTPHVSSAIVARVFLDPDLRLFDYDPECLLSQTPEMFAFSNLRDIYQTIMSNSNAKCFLNRSVERVVRTSSKVKVTDDKQIECEFDEIVFACDAETCLKLLGTEASFMERRVLGNVAYFNDVTITHEDTAYMNKYYEIDLKRNDQYFVRIDAQHPERIDMSFNLSNYQPQLIDYNRSRAPNEARNIWQTIFLDDRRATDWSRDEIDKEKVLLEKWWRQMAHTWKHFAFTVPFMRFLQGKKRSWFAGAYTLFNTHEMAVISGLAVAVRLGAKYPFTNDELATKQFDQYLKYSHGFRRRS